MSVGVLLMTHESMGAALVNAARHVLGRLPLPIEVQEVAANADPDQMLRAAAANARELDHGDGVLVLSDLYGATPCNIAQRLPDLGVRMTLGEHDVEELRALLARRDQHNQRLYRDIGHLTIDLERSQAALHAGGLGRLRYLANRLRRLLGRG